MKTRRPEAGFVLAIGMVCSLFLLFLAHPCVAEDTASIVVVERDVPQVFDGTAIVNHTTYVINLSDTALEVTLQSVLPRDLYRQSDMYPRFGEEAQLDLRMQAPFEVEIEEFCVLDKPAIEKAATHVTYAWNKVSLPPHEAVIIYFDNYLGEAERFHSAEGLDLSRLLIDTQYQAVLNQDNAEISLAYEIKNTSSEEIKFLQFQLFFPHAIINVDNEANGGNVQLLDITRYCLSSGVQIEPWTIADGFGNAAEGHSILSRWKVLEPGQSDRLEASFFGVKAREKGEIYPLFIINGRMDGTRLLEPTVVESMTDINVGRFYYTHYATAIPDSTLFKFSEDDITVVSAAEVEQPTFVTYVPKEIPTGPISPPSAGSIEGGEVPQIVPPQ